MKSYKTALLVFLLIYCTLCKTSAQLKGFNNNVRDPLAAQGRSHQLFKLSLVSSIQKGISIGAGYGMWQEGPSLQYSLNTGFMWRIGRGFLGNYRNGLVPKDIRSRGQFVFMFSPMLTARLFSHDYRYQELEPFYLGTPNAVFSKYKNSLTLGSTFTISPRGSYRNVATIRNRAQQDFMISLNIQKFNLTIYDDYFPIFTKVLQLGDNWDRFFTGGGFIRYRFSDEFTLHIFSEVYTGINRSNAFLNPDIISYHRSGKKLWKQKNFANQDPGQEFFNNSWFIIQGTYTSQQQPGNNPGFYVPDVNMFIGTSKPWTMFSQNLVHSSIGYDTTNSLQLHYFLPRTNVPGNLEAGSRNSFINFLNSLFIGGGAAYNILKP